MKQLSLNKTEILGALETQVESHLREVISIVQNLPDDILHKPSVTGGWSIAQCLDHLNSYGHFYLPQIKKAIEGQNGKRPTETFTSTWLGKYFTRSMNPETGKKKYKAFKNHRPGSNLDAHAVVAEFIQQQEILLSYLKAAKQVDLNTAKVPLSIFSWITFKLGDAFQFLIAHNERHMVQARRNMAS